MRNLKYINIAEKIFEKMNINDNNIEFIDANGWIYFSFRFFEETGILLDIDNLTDNYLKKKDEFLIYITSLSERSKKC